MILMILTKFYCVFFLFLLDKKNIYDILRIGVNQKEATR